MKNTRNTWKRLTNGNKDDNALAALLISALVSTDKKMIFRDDFQEEVVGVAKGVA